MDQRAVEQLHADSTDLIYAATADARPAQLRAADTHDAKATAVFASAAIVIGLAAAAGSSGLRLGCWLGGRRRLVVLL
ncbi:MAG TPA: hypothetical protein VFJ24_00080 [Gaiellales bacterium]|nr:hypothetical protein [Gaiellales bacterium]